MALKIELAKAGEEGGVDFQFIGKGTTWKLLVGKDIKTTSVGAAKSAVSGASTVKGTCKLQSNTYTFFCETGTKPAKKLVQDAIKAEWNGFSSPLEISGGEESKPTESEESQTAPTSGWTSATPSKKRQFDMPSGEEIKDLRQDIQDVDAIKQELRKLQPRLVKAKTNPDFANQIHGMEVGIESSIEAQQVPQAQAKLDLLKQAVNNAIEDLADKRAKDVKNPKADEAKKKVNDFGEGAEALAKSLIKAGGKFSKGLPLLAKQVLDIGKDAKGKHLDENKFLAKVSRTQADCDAYIKSHLESNKGKEDDQVRAARDLKAKLDEIYAGLTNFPDVDQGLSTFKGLRRDEPEFREEARALAKMTAQNSKLPAVKKRQIVDAIVATGDVDLLVECGELSGDDTFAQSMCDTHGNNPGLMKNVIGQFAKPQLEKSGNRTAVMRGLDIGSRTMRAYGKNVGKEAIHSSTSKSLSTFKQVKVDLEIDPLKVSDEFRAVKGKDESDKDFEKRKESLKKKEMQALKEIEKRVVVHKKMAQDFIENFTSDENLEKFPQEIKDLSKMIYDEVVKQNPIDGPDPTENQKNLDHVMGQVGGFVMLRLVNPAMFDEMSDIQKENPDDTKINQQHRTMIVQTKIYQNLANGQEFSAKEPYMGPFNEVVRDNKGKMQGALMKLVNGGR